MVAQTNHQTTKYAAENKWHSDLFMNREKPTQQKPHRVIFRSPLLSQQIVISKGITVPYTNLQLNPYPNIQLDLFCSNNFPFNTRLPSTWLINCVNPNTRLQSPTREVCWLQSSSVHPHDEDQEDAWSQNPMMHIHNNFFRRDELGWNFISDYKLFEQTLLNTCATCIYFDGP